MALPHSGPNRRKQPKNPEALVLVRQVMEMHKAVVARDLMPILGLMSLDDEKRIRNWVKGDNAPDFDGTMRLLRAAGRLREANEDAAQQAVAIRRAREVAVRVADGVEELARILGVQAEDA